MSIVFNYMEILLLPWNNRKWLAGRSTTWYDKRYGLYRFDRIELVSYNIW